MKIVITPETKEDREWLARMELNTRKDIRGLILELTLAFENSVKIVRSDDTLLYYASTETEKEK